MSEYLTLMKKKIDNLQLVGYPMDLRSFISHVIAGLDDDYTPIVCVIRNRDMTWSEIQFELLSYEQRMDRLQAMKNNQISPLQSIVSAGKHCSSYDSSSNDHYQTNQNSGSYYNVWEEEVDTLPICQERNQHVKFVQNMATLLSFVGFDMLKVMLPTTPTRATQR